MMYVVADACIPCMDKYTGGAPWVPPPPSKLAFLHQKIAKYSVIEIN